MRYNVEYSTAKYCDIARVFGASGETGLALAREGIARVEALLARLGANRGKILRFFPCDFAAHVPQ